MSLASRRFVRIAAPATIAAMVASMVLGSPAGAAQAPVGLGTATSFAVLAGSGITNTGATTITGDIGTFPTATITGLATITLVPPSVNNADNAVTQGAKVDLQTAYDDAASRLPVIAADADFAGETLTPGVYTNGTLGLTGVLTLDFQGDATSQFVFKASSTLITGPAASVVMINTAGNDACRVVWQVGSSATFDTTTSFVGDVLAHTSITANAGATFQGRLLALNGAVTLINNTINRGSCTQIAATPTTTTTATTARRRSGGSSSATTSTTRRPTTTTSTTAAPTTTTTITPPTTSTTIVKVIGTTGGAPTPTPTPTTTIDPSVTGQGQQSPPTPPGSPTAPVTPGTPPSIPELPRTGTSTLVLAISGAVLVVLGSAAVRIERRAGSAELV